MKGVVNPVFNEPDGAMSEERSHIQDKLLVGFVSRDSSSSANRYTLPRPQSVNLPSMDNRNDFLVRDDLCTSQNSLDQNEGLFKNAAVNNEVGSSLSMDSGNPLGRQSLESLDDRSHNTPPNTSPGEACSDVSRYLIKAFCYLSTCVNRNVDVVGVLQQL